MSDLEKLMHQWLATGTDAQKAHARARIAIGFEASLPTGTVIPHDAPGSLQHALIRPEWRDAIDTCLYRECRTGCSLSKCWAGRGEWSNGDTSKANCIRCLKQERDR